MLPTMPCCRRFTEIPSTASVSQAIVHGLTIVTPDTQIARYPAPVLW